ncbi:MAG: nicotinate-nucleotide adenylyltransferase [Pyrinomonadaceae bacterium]|nr:nicotinate-nucleotide adenylyltransferase [Pyrinomonadaceae bacterium]
MNFSQFAKSRRVAFYGGSFDPLHNGHLTIARKLTELFSLDEFFFVPASHAPHKKDKQPTSAFHRLAMISLATKDESKIKVSTIELDAPEKPFTFETQTKLKNELANTEIFFVIGADSWAEIDTWREWEKVLTLTNIIVVTRPTYEIGFSHVTQKIRERIIDLRGQVSGFRLLVSGEEPGTDKPSPVTKIYITDVVNLDVSATEIRRKIRADENDWRELVPVEVAKHIEKYELYI